MKKIFILVLLGFLQVNAGDWIKESIDLTINSRFDAAQQLLQKRMDNGDSSLAVYFYYASVLNSKMTHFENQIDEQPFFDALNRVIDKGEKQLDHNDLTDKKAAEICFFIGSSYGYLGFYEGKTGQWFSALSNGENAYNYLKKAVDLDSTIWDAYLGLGAYKYWVSTKIRWIPFVPDDRDEGIRLIMKTIRHNAHSKYMAIHQLIYILLDYGRFEEAADWAGLVVAEYPESPFMRWAHSHVYMKMKDYPKAIASYKTLLQLIKNDPNSNENHRITCMARLADMYARSDSCKQAIEIKDKIVDDVFYRSLNDGGEVQRLVQEISERCQK
ncbi:MAG: hypothetical protein KDF60_11860 [Calditrichaeota bacterium]|nr:hypothetical protein [Calditrichota bacterium]